ncbi:hypothetical protein [Mycobacterium palustre]|uniref:Uncharacterized protein n=1 Tax=Mycobacterium palustre TaxID=153971 RepID=A0A1X1ZCB7_9MYCO|nr:hypothetical protein [Mycobacterium palustre]MCV7100058.1 hypothetical protein [Mycobacterium palustre]ORW20926.1 hypothetical protein AWC19_14275 [Mycobacterium palustre]
MTTLPSPKAIADITEVLQLASLLDHRVPNPDKARIMAWARQIDRHNLERDDMLDAVQAFYDRPSQQPISVGDIIETARRIKRDRLDREADHDREARQQTLDIKAAGDVQAVATSIVMGPVANKTERLIKAETALQCAVDKRTAQEAIREFFAAKREAQGEPA